MLCQIAIVNTPEKYHNADSCCKILNKKCNEEIRTKLQLPLEIVYPDIFGDLDGEQLDLAGSGSLPVVVLENASELVSQMKNIHGFIEQIVKYIIQDNKSDYVFMGSYTLPYVLKDTWINTYTAPDAEKYGEGNLTTEYEQIINSIKSENKNIPNKAMLHIGAEIGEVGHYGVIIKNGNDIIIFDSMQSNLLSSYTGFFSQITEDVFGIKGKTLSSPSSDETCPQLTGGFVSPREKKESKESYSRRLQDLDSQNHFCYMWSIWYFHVFVTQGKQGLENLFEDIHKNCIPPLVVIKRYIWSILNSLYPTNKALNDLIKEVIEQNHERKITPSAVTFITYYFLMNFRYVWDDLGSGKFNLYSVIECDLSKVRKLDNMNKCLEYSLEKVPYVLDKFTE